MNFINEQVFPDHLPKYQQVTMQGLEDNYLKVLYITRMIPAVILLVAYVILMLFLGEGIPFWIIVSAGGILFVLLLAFVLLSRKVFAIKQYALRKHDVIYTSGWIIRNTTVLPFNRVQHVEIKHGPIDRMFGLSSLKIFTAGGSQSDMVIPGLERERAQRIKELIVNKTGQDEEE